MIRGTGNALAGPSVIAERGCAQPKPPTTPGTPSRRQARMVSERPPVLHPRAQAGGHFAPAARPPPSRTRLRPRSQRLWRTRPRRKAAEFRTKFWPGQPPQGGLRLQSRSPASSTIRNCRRNQFHRCQLERARGGSNAAALYDDPPGPARSLLAGPFSGYALRWIVQRGGGYCARVCSVDSGSQL